ERLECRREPPSRPCGAAEHERRGIGKFVSLEQLPSSLQVFREYKIEARHTTQFAVLNADQIAKIGAAIFYAAVQVDQNDALPRKWHLSRLRVRKMMQHALRGIYLMGLGAAMRVSPTGNPRLGRLGNVGTQRFEAAQTGSLYPVYNTLLMFLP